MQNLLKIQMSPWEQGDKSEGKLKTRTRDNEHITKTAHETTRSTRAQFWVLRVMQEPPRHRSVHEAHHGPAEIEMDE